MGLIFDHLGGPPAVTGPHLREDQVRVLGRDVELELEVSLQEREGDLKMRAGP